MDRIKNLKPQRDFGCFLVHKDSMGWKNGCRCSALFNFSFFAQIFSKIVLLGIESPISLPPWSLHLVLSCQFSHHFSVTFCNLHHAFKNVRKKQFRKWLANRWCRGVNKFYFGNKISHSLDCQLHVNKHWLELLDANILENFYFLGGVPTNFHSTVLQAWSIHLAGTKINK